MKRRYPAHARVVPLSPDWQRPSDAHARRWQRGERVCVVCGDSARGSVLWPEAGLYGLKGWPPVGTRPLRVPHCRRHAATGFWPWVVCRALLEALAERDVSTALGGQSRP